MEQGKRYLTIDQLEKIPWLIHGFGLAGFSQKDFKLDNRLISFTPVEMKQEHSARVFFLDKAPSGRLSGDGLITSTPGLLLIIKTADCLPVFLVDTAHKTVAAVHCGWRSTYQKILLVAFNVMQQKIGSRPQELRAALGPGIEQRCYEVGQEVFKLFCQAGFKAEDIFSVSEAKDKYYLDLRKANLWLLTEVMGLRMENIFPINLCTFCQPELYSFRRDREKNLRLINFIGIK
ncbi:MAG: peptidoglycan editing factor PgeF [Candidatus Saccharicenans sp.]